MVPRTIRPYRRVVLFFGGDSLDCEYEYKTFNLVLFDVFKKSITSRRNGRINLNYERGLGAIYNLTLEEEIK